MQFEFPGTLPVPDGSYLARDDSARKSVLVIETLSVPPPPSRRRRAPAGESRELEHLPVGRATVVRAWEPFDSAERAAEWLEQEAGSDESLERVLADGIALLNRALHARGIAEADPHFREETVDRAVSVRLGYGTGEEVAAGRFSLARDVEAAKPSASRRNPRDRELRPQEAIAAALTGREHPDVCETLLLRVRAELAGGRPREAALQLPAALRALKAELTGALVDPGHTQDMEALESRSEEAEAAAKAALEGDMNPPEERNARELLELGERILRRRRVRRG